MTKQVHKQVLDQLLRRTPSNIPNPNPKVSTPTPPSFLVRGGERLEAGRGSSSLGVASELNGRGRSVCRSAHAQVSNSHTRGGIRVFDGQ